MKDDKILQRYVEGNASKEEVKEVLDWLDADEAHVREFMALHKLNDIAVLNKSASTHNDKLPANKSKKHYGKIAYEWLKIAAIFAICWIGIRYFYADKKTSPDPVRYQTLFIPAGQRAELTLPDSTKVWLNASTQLIYPVSFGNNQNHRTVTLDGEAYFEVKRNDKQPFIIKTKTMDVHVLGTELNVMAYSAVSAAQVALLKGAADIKTTTDNATGIARKHSMKINEQVTLRNGRLDTSRIEDFEYFKWKDGLLCFNDEPVETMIEKLQLYFDIRIKVENKNLHQYNYTGKFRTKDGVEQVLKVLQLEHHFTYTRDNELNLITIR